MHCVVLVYMYMQIEELEARQRALLQQQNGDDADGARPGDNAVAQVSVTHLQLYTV